MKTREDHKAALNELFAQLAENKYSVVIRIFYFKKESRNCIFYGQIFPVKSGEDYQEEVLDYENCAFIQEIIPNHKVVDWFQTFWPKEQPIGGGETELVLRFGKIKIVSPSKPLVKKDSTTITGFREIKSIAAFPLVFTMNFSEKAGSVSERIGLNNPNQPYFPQVDNLISNKFGFDIGINNAFQNTLHIMVFSTKGHIKGIITEENRNLIEVNRFTEESLVLKIYQEDIRGNNDTEDHWKLGGTSKVSIPSDVKKVEMVLIDSKCDLLDHKQYLFEKLTPLDEIRNMILAGEGVEVEFKLWETFNSTEERNIKRLKQEKREKFTKLMCAFANTKGGHILFGVNDEADIEGIGKNTLDEIETFLQEIIDRKIKPIITITRSEITLDEGKVGSIYITKSDKRVMNLYDKRYYVRRGSTNRVMYPEEINRTEDLQSFW